MRRNGWTDMLIVKPIVGIVEIVALLASAGCGGDTYCQSGPKYGTTCYSMSDVRAAHGDPRPPPAEPQWRARPPKPTPLPPASPSSTSMSSPYWRPSADAGAQ
ncbi:MAG TPA: hypothetical protein VJT73_21230 [Polyangiaceae bacterium]|nr:hypothetical protein [Polyangiaceae bacterium]